MKQIIFDGIKFTRDEKTGYYLSSKNINGRRIRLHVYVWTKKNGDVPKGYSIHHIDENKENNDVENLMPISSSLHSSHHTNERLESPEYREAQKKLLSRIRQKASDWHKSDEGRKWHSEHYEDMKSRWYKEKTYTCENCGNVFTSKMPRARFCCLNCGNQHRWLADKNVIEKTCQSCGKKYKTNKWKPNASCSRSCAQKNRQKTERLAK